MRLGIGVTTLQEETSAYSGKDWEQNTEQRGHTARVVERTGRLVQRGTEQERQREAVIASRGPQATLKQETTTMNRQAIAAVALTLEPVVVAVHPGEQREPDQRLGIDRAVSGNAERGSGFAPPARCSS